MSSNAWGKINLIIVVIITAGIAGKSIMDITKLCRYEIEFPGYFADKVIKPYGILFYNQLNPESTDSNHGVIMSPGSELERVVDELILFYRMRALIPAVYTAFQQWEDSSLIPVLARKGFIIERLKWKLFVHQQPSRVKPAPEITFRRLNNLQDHLSEIMIPEKIMTISGCHKKLMFR